MDETDDENFDSFFRDAPWQEEFECDISQGCPPPLFDLPPPPRPPWLEDDSDSCDSLSAYESCENIVIIDSGVRLEETFQNLIIIAVCSAILVILLVFTVACIWRIRKRGSGGCHCKDPKPDSNKQVMEMTETVGRPYQEVYDNPNYSHIMIGGQPFFILPSGELSGHVPVPDTVHTLSVTPRNITSAPANHIYEGGSSTYRSTSDYDTDSSNFKPESDKASDSFHPIYEEIDKPNGHHPGRHPQLMSQRSPPECLPRTGRSPPAQAWSPQPAHGQHVQPPTLSPRSRAGYSPRTANSIYYYSDTLKRRGDDISRESDSGHSSRSGQNTSSESTPRHLAMTNGHGPRHQRHSGARSYLSSRGQQLGGEPVSLHDKVDTQIIVTSSSGRSREPIVKV